MTDYPQGDGRPDCPECHGRGVLPAPPPKGFSVFGSKPCPCVLVRDIARNIERGWHGLLAADPVPDSPLKGHTKANLRVTGSLAAFRSHLKHVAARMPPTWGFLVVSDADLMNAWLSRHLNVRDADVSQMRQQAEVRLYDSLVDLIEPAEILIIYCGVKAARNEAMPEVLLEVLQHRGHLSKKTWVVDHPDAPLADGHISYSRAVGEYLQSWKRVRLDEGGGKKQAFSPARPRPNPLHVDIPVLSVAPLSDEEVAEAVDQAMGPSAHTNKTTSYLSDTDGDAPKKKWRR